VEASNLIYIEVVRFSLAVLDPISQIVAPLGTAWQQNRVAPWILAQQDRPAALNFERFQYEPPAKLHIQWVARQFEAVASCATAR
jgi:hypothetical protein